MHGQVKWLRERGKRLSGHAIGAALAIAGEVRMFGLEASTVASVTDPNSRVGGSLLPLLYDARVTTMQNAGMLIEGEERPEGDEGPGLCSGVVRQIRPAKNSTDIRCSSNKQCCSYIQLPL